MKLALSTQKTKIYNHLTAVKEIWKKANQT